MSCGTRHVTCLSGLPRTPTYVQQSVSTTEHPNPTSLTRPVGIEIQTAPPNSCNTNEQEVNETKKRGTTTHQMTRTSTKHIQTSSHWSTGEPRGTTIDNDHVSSQLSGHAFLTCPEGQSAWALAPSLSGKVLASCKKQLFRGCSYAGSCHLE